MECTKCGKKIFDGEKYYAWTFSIESARRGFVTVHSAQDLKVHCLACGPAEQSVLVKEWNAKIN